MLGPIAPTEGTATAQLRGRNRPSAGFGVNRVKDGFTLGALRVSSGPPGTVEADTGAGVSPISGAAGGGRRSTSLFDRARSGHGVLERLRGQPRSVSPLTAGFGGASALSATVASTTESTAAPAAEREERRLANFGARQASLRSGYRRADDGSRFLLAQSNSRRTPFGYAQQPADDESLFGGGLSLFGGGISLFG